MLSLLLGVQFEVHLLHQPLEHAVVHGLGQGAYRVVDLPGRSGQVTSARNGARKIGSAGNGRLVMAAKAVFTIFYAEKFQVSKRMGLKPKVPKFWYQKIENIFS